MRMRINKLLILLVAGVIILIICISYATNSEKYDAFITHLSLEATQKPARKSAFRESEHQQVSFQPVSQLLNLTGFKYTLENDLCRKYDKELLAIIIVTSYVGHDDLRSAHRQAISQSTLAEMGFQRIFLLAEIPTTERFIKQVQLVNEHHRFGDLLQGNFEEAYRNLSYKHVMGLRWAASDCTRAKFIIKMDDDIVYDVFQLRRYLDSLELQQTKLAASTELLAGYILDSMPPIRILANKWYVSEDEYAGAIYPEFLSGWLYITNPPTARRLVQEAQRSPIFWIDDTWVTGMLRNQLQIPMLRLNAWFSANSEFLDCCVHDLKKFNYECEYFVGPNGGDSKLLIEFLHNVEKCYFDECVKRAPEKSLKRTCVAEAKNIVPDHGDALVREIKLR